MGQQTCLVAIQNNQILFRVDLIILKCLISILLEGHQPTDLNSVMSNKLQTFNKHQRFNQQTGFKKFSAHFNVFSQIIALMVFFSIKQRWLNYKLLETLVIAPICCNTSTPYKTWWEFFPPHILTQLFLFWNPPSPGFSVGCWWVSILRSIK